MIQSTLKDFQILNKLGQGAFGQVWKVKRREDNKEYALKKVKLIAMKQKQRQNAVNEIRILASLNNEFIIGYKDAFYDQSTSTLCIVMEYASGGDILKKINSHIKNKTRFKQEQIWRALIHMTKGLKSLHDKKILHRDLKCANVFITNQGIYKLGDLNVSKVLKKGMAYTQTGTPYYASPQVWQDLPYDMKSDMWSLGCVIYEMAALRPPFQAVDLQGLFKKVKTGIFQRIPSIYSNDLASLIGILLKVAPRLRPSTQQILNMPITAKYYKSTWNQQKLELNENKNLLQTIKFNPNNLKALKDKLPRSNYFKEKQKDPTNNQELLDLFQKMEKKKSSKNSLQIDIHNRQRIVSACGRVSNVYNSPRIQYQEKKEIPQIKIIQNNNVIKLPPKPPGSSAQQKLPPKPQYVYYNPNLINKQIDSKINNSYQDIIHNHQVIQSIENSRDKSKENLRKIAQNILNHNRIIRSNSVDRIEPSW